MNVDVLKQEDQRLFNRKVVLLAHVLAALFTAVLYLNQVDFTRFYYWRRSAGAEVLFAAAPALVPYLISAVHSWRKATHNRLRVAAFLVILVLGAGAACSAIVGIGGFSLARSDLFRLFVIQAAVYFFAAEFLFDVD
jgi:hypothetical protein